MKGVITIDPQLVLWDAQTGKQRWSVTTEFPEVRSVAVSPDGSLIASGHNFGELALWDAGSGALIRTLEGHTWAVTSVAFSDSGLLASASQDASIRLWDASTGREIRELAGHPEGVFAIAFEPDQRHLVSGGYDHLVRRWDVESGAEVGGPGKHAQAVCAIAIAPTGLIATGSSSRHLRPSPSPPTPRCSPRRWATGSSAGGSRPRIHSPIFVATTQS